MSRRFAGNPWLLLIAAAGWVGCSFDSSKLSVSAKPDARVSTDLPVAPADAAFALADVRDTADQSSDEAAIVMGGDGGSEFEAPPDEPVLAPPDVAPAPEVAVPLDVVASPPVDTGSIDQVRLGDTAQATDVAEDVPGDTGTCKFSGTCP